MATSISPEVQQLVNKLKQHALKNETCRAEVRDALQLASSEIETPFEQLHLITFAGPALASALKTCLSLNLFALWERNGGGSKSTGELAELTKSDPILLGRLLRHISAMDKITEIGRDQYRLKPFTEAMAKPGISNGIGLLYHSTWPVLTHLPTWLQEKGYKNPTDPDDTAFHSMNGSKVSWFEQLELDAPQGRLTDFQNVMQMYATQSGNWTELYPTAILFESYDPQCPLLVDAGGGKGQDLEMFRAKHLDLTKGSLVLEELPVVVETIPYNLDESIRVLGHNLFQEQPVKGARAYFTHSVFHGWTNEQSLQVLKNFAAAMQKDYSKLLLNEKVVPAEHASKAATTSDVIMMATFSAHERTQAEWEDLLAQAGLRFVKVWLTPIFPEGIIEAELS